MYKTNPNMIIEDTTADEIIMYDTENKNTIILNFTAKMLYENFVNSDYTSGLNQYLNTASNIFNKDTSELVKDANDTYEYLLKNNILVNDTAVRC